MKKFAMILAAALTVGIAASAQPQGGPGFGGPGQHGPGYGPGAPGQEQSLTSEQKAQIAKKYTDRMHSTLTLTEKQYKKAYKVNKKYADVLPPVKRQHAARPEAARSEKKGADGPHYDTPGRPHPSGNNGVPGSWSRDDRERPSLEAVPAGEGFEGQGPDEKTMKKVEKRKAAYDKKIAKVLTAEQKEAWDAKTVR